MIMMVADEFDAVVVALEPHPKGAYITLWRNGELVNVNFHQDDLKRLVKAHDAVVEFGDDLADIPQDKRIRFTDAGVRVLADKL